MLDTFLKGALTVSRKKRKEKPMMPSSRMYVMVHVGIVCIVPTLLASPLAVKVLSALLLPLFAWVPASISCYSALFVRATATQTTVVVQVLAAVQVVVGALPTE